jgi:hypothetical protein
MVPFGRLRVSYRLTTSGSPLLPEGSQEFDLVIQHLDFESAFIDVVYYMGKDFVGVTGVVADTSHAEGGQLPGIVIVDLRNTDAELVLDAGDDRLNNLPFTLEGLIFRQA